MYLLRVAMLLGIIYSSCGHFAEVSTGLFKEEDVIVAKDTFYRPRVPFKIVYGYYYRKVKCPISYIKVVDRLGVKPGPTASISRGGLRHNYVVLLIGSVYNRPSLVDVYIACEDNDSVQRGEYDEY